MNKNFWNVGKGLVMITVLAAAVYGIKPTGISGEGRHRRIGGGTSLTFGN